MNYTKIATFYENLVGHVELHKTCRVRFFLVRLVGGEQCEQQLGDSIESKAGTNYDIIKNTFQRGIELAEKDPTVRMMKVMITTPPNWDKEKCEKLVIELTPDEYMFSGVAPIRHAPPAPDHSERQRPSVSEDGGQMSKVLLATLLGVHGIDPNLGDVDDSPTKGLMALSQVNQKILEERIQKEKDAFNFHNVTTERNRLATEVAQLKRDVEKKSEKISRLEKENGDLHEQIKQLDPDKTIMGVALKGLAGALAGGFAQGLAKTPIGQGLANTLSGLTGVPVAEEPHTTYEEPTVEPEEHDQRSEIMDKIVEWARQLNEDDFVQFVRICEQCMINGVGGQTDNK